MGVQLFRLNNFVSAAHWVVAFRNFPHSNQDTNAAIEGYHSSLKSRLSQSQKRLTGRRADWLLHVLMGELLEYHRNLVYYKQHGYILNQRQEQLTINAVLKVQPFDGLLCHARQ